MNYAINDMDKRNKAYLVMIDSLICHQCYVS